MRGTEIVIDAGPIPYEAMALHGDPDLEHGLRHAGLEPSETSYRLIEIPLDAIGDVATMREWQNMGRAYIDKVLDGVEFPPIVVMPSRLGWTLLDGVNRTHAYLMLGRPTVRAYDLIDASRAFV
jgi:hypothetical protein